MCRLSREEVTRRLGMVGRIDELHSISMWLADAYNPREQLAMVPKGLMEDDRALVREVRPKPSQEFHPLRMLFSDQRQRAIVEWSFIHGMTAFASYIQDKRELAQMIPRNELKKKAIQTMLRGVHFLKQLGQRGVYIKEMNVQRACYERMVILYGPGISSKKYNRAVRSYNPVTLLELAQAIEGAWGRPLWHDKKMLEWKIRNEDRWDAVLPTNERQPERIAWKAENPMLKKWPVDEASNNDSNAMKVEGEARTGRRM